MKDKLVNFFMSEEKKKELDILSKREGRTLKDIINELIDEYIKVHKEGNPQHTLISYQENEDFSGFPSMAVTLENKRKYIGNLTPKMEKELYWHVQEWYNLLQKK